ncbi:hypothetical protein EBR96_04830 [bacterium]|nr:hypothetical protein [bacterium]
MAEIRSDRYRLIDQIHGMGVCEGDILLLRADMGALAKTKSHSGARFKLPDYLNIFLEALGENGTLVSLAFNPICRRPDRNVVYDRFTKPYTGALAQIMVNDSRSVRSAHPLESFVAIGKDAAELMSGHTADTFSFFPIGKMLEKKAKMLLVGCTKNSPGFSTVHYVQHILGLSKQVVSPDSDRCYYKDPDGKIKLYVSNEIPGCSRGFYKFYSHYAQNEFLRTGYIGGAYCLAVDMEQSYTTETRLLSEDPSFFCCSDKNCWYCASRYLPNRSKFPRRFIRKWLGV